MKICPREISQKSIIENYTTRIFISLRYIALWKISPFTLGFSVLREFFSWFSPLGLLEVGMSVVKKSVWLQKQFSDNWYWSDYEIWMRQIYQIKAPWSLLSKSVTFFTPSYWFLRRSWREMSYDKITYGISKWVTE